MLNSPSLKNNLLNLWKKLELLPNWKILEHEDILCLKSPTSFPWFNMSWGIVTLEDLKIAQSFFKDHPFCISSISGGIFEFDVKKYFLESENDTEMHRDLTHFEIVPLPDWVTIRQVSSLADFEKFIEISGRVFSIPYKDMYTFMVPMQKYAFSFLAFFKEECVGTSQVYVEDRGFAGLQTISVLEEYRRRGIGRALTEACLQKSYSVGSRNAGLTASQQGTKLYNQMGFKAMQYWDYRITKE